MEKNQAIKNVEGLEKSFEMVRKAQEAFSSYSQEQIDEIFLAVALTSNRERIAFAKLAVEETGMGVLEDKVIKNHLASEYVYNKYRYEKTCGVVERDEALGIERIACPIGIIGAVIPTTNPTSTTIFKILLALKTRNGIIISPHPKAKKCTIAVAKTLLDAAVAAGAPQNIISWIDEPNIELTNMLMSKSDLILATGGPAMVKAAYSSGRPAIGVGAGNTPVIIDSSANILLAVNSIIHSKSFDNGMICASEQAVIIIDDIYDLAREEFKKRGCYFLNEKETEQIRAIIFIDGALNPKMVGKDACEIAVAAGIRVDEKTKILIAEIESADSSEALAHEKLSPVLAMYRVKSFDDAIVQASRLIQEGGLGHTASIYLNELEENKRLDKFKDAMKACRILVNTPSSHGGVGDVYNFGLAPSLTLGCGSWGGNSVSENVGVKHLLNIKTVALRRENMLWFKAPKKIYIKKGCLGAVFNELKRTTGKRKAFVVTDNFLFEHGYLRPIISKLNEIGLEYEIFHDVNPDPTLDSVKAGACRMSEFCPDTIIAFGGGSAIDAAKIMWALYEYPELDFSKMTVRFSDIMKRIYKIPQMGNKAYFIAIPTSAGTGSEVTPFAVITDESSGLKYPIADYELMPNVAIIDVDYHMSAPKSLTAASGIDALTHALEAYTSVMATDYTDAMALHAIKLIFDYLPRAYERGNIDIVAREKMANAATMAGMAFANAFLGVCHSMAHKLGSYHHLPHGVSNALLIEHTLRFNADEMPRKMGTFSQYDHPMALPKYSQIADYLGIGGANSKEKLEGLILAINKLKKQLGIKATIREYGIEEEEFLATLDEMSESAFDDQCTGANPRYPLVGEIREMYLKAYYGENKNC